MGDFLMRAYCRWENTHNNRYYAARTQKDLFGDWAVIVCWGKKNTNLGRLKSVFCETENKAFDYLKKLDSTRIRHGYALIINEDLKDGKN